MNNIFEGHSLASTVVDITEFVEPITAYRCKLCSTVFESSSGATKHIIATHLRSSRQLLSGVASSAHSAKPVTEQGTGLLTVPLSSKIFPQIDNSTQSNSLHLAEPYGNTMQKIVVTTSAQGVVAGNNMGETFIENSFQDSVVDSHHHHHHHNEASVVNNSRQLRVLINGVEVWLSVPDEIPVQANTSGNVSRLSSNISEASAGDGVLQDVDDKPDALTRLNLGLNKSQNGIEVTSAASVNHFPSQLVANTFTNPDVQTEMKTNGEMNVKEYYLCSKCQVGFASMDDWKKHAMQQHQESLGLSQTPLPDVLMPPNTVSVGTQAQMYKKPGRKRKIAPGGEVVHLDGGANTDPPIILDVPSVNEPEVCSAAVNAVNMLGIARTDAVTGLSKRRVRAPKALVEDYYISRRKHRKRQASAETLSFACHIKGCTAKFSNSEYLSYHLKCHGVVGADDAPTASFVCPECKNLFAMWKILRMHLWKTHNINSGLFKCEAETGSEVCQYRTDSLQKLQLHQEMHGGDTRMFGCRSCKKEFKHRNQLRSHEAMHVDGRGGQPSISDANKECHVCKRVFANQKSLKKHIEIVHHKQKPFVCNVCGHETSRKAMLDLHLRTHSGEKPYRCDMCNYTASDHNTLRRHRMRHTGEKPYKCHYCTYMCIQAISLKTHLKNKHPGCEGIYSCDSCQYHTVNKHHWLNHLEDHKNNLIATDVLSLGPDPVSGTAVAGRDGVNARSRIVCVGGITDRQNVAMSQDRLGGEISLRLKPYSGSRSFVDATTIGRAPDSAVEMVELNGVPLIQGQEVENGLFADGKATGQQIAQMSNESEGFYVILNEQGQVIMQKIDEIVTSDTFIQQPNFVPASGVLLSNQSDSGQVVYATSAADNPGDVGLHHILTAIQQQTSEAVVPTAKIEDES